jgi:hypothetical protein
MTLHLKFKPDQAERATLRPSRDAEFRLGLPVGQKIHSIQDGRRSVSIGNNTDETITARLRAGVNYFVTIV